MTHTHNSNSSMSKKNGVALSQGQMENFLSGYNSSILHYDDLPKFNSLLEIFHDQDYPFRVIFLGSDKVAVGHWVLLINRTDKVFEYFDPLGYAPDELNSLMNRNPELQRRRFLTELCQRHEKLDCKRVAVQSEKSNNCGRFVIDRILKMKMNNSEYYDLMTVLREKYDLDRYIVDALGIPQ